MQCSRCGNQKLIAYNPNKKQNLLYYIKMARAKLLPKAKLKELELFWARVRDTECPKCGKKRLVWKSYK